MRKKRLDRYPPEFWQIVRLAVENGMHAVDCPSYEKARALRESFYNFRSVLNDGLREQMMADKVEEDFLLTTTRANRLIISLDKTKVRFYVPTN